MNYNIAELTKLADSLVKELPLLNGINTEKEYDDIIRLMDELVENHEENENFINLLVPVIEQYEDTAPQFAAFNASIEKLDNEN